MEEDAITVFCLAHGRSFTTTRSSRKVICAGDEVNPHVLGDSFSNSGPNSGRWFYCCHCKVFWAAENGPDSLPKQCPACGMVKNPRYYACDQCKVTMMDTWGATGRRDVSIMPWGAPHPYCPGCYNLPKSIPLSHTCPKLNGLITTPHATCPFCEVAEEAAPFVEMAGAEGPAGAPSVAEPEKPEADMAAELHNASGEAPAQTPNWIQIESEASELFLADFEKMAAELQELEAQALAREAAAQERLLQIESRLAQEELLRSVIERKSKGIEEALRQKPEFDGENSESDVETAGSEEKPVKRFLFEALSLIAGGAAQIGAERGAPLPAEQTNAAAETEGDEYGTPRGAAPDRMGPVVIAPEEERPAAVKVCKAAAANTGGGNRAVETAGPEGGAPAGNREVEANLERQSRTIKAESPRPSSKPRLRTRRGRRKYPVAPRRPKLALRSRTKPRRKGRPHF